MFSNRNFERGITCFEKSDIAWLLISSRFLRLAFKSDPQTHTGGLQTKNYIWQRETSRLHVCARFSDHNGGWIQKVGVQRVLYSSSGIWVVYCHSELFQCVAKVMRFRKSLMHL